MANSFENDAPRFDPEEPPVMWPDQDSGFEANPMSPAGTAQREWILYRALSRNKIARWCICGIAGIFVIAFVIAQLQ